MSSPVKSTYRKDIDGLRAIAVLSVVVFHLDKSWLPGGFAGVDVFFVISGFLITGVIHRDLVAQEFTFRRFYRKRIQRILPVLAVVILVTLVVGNFVLLPGDYTRLAKSGGAAQLSFSNIYFAYFLDTSYFADDANLEPLLHTWSLGVEEQFYLFFPILMWIGLYKLGWKKIVFIFTAGFTVSVVTSQLLTKDSPMVAYYMLHSRAFQLLAGGVCFYLPSWFTGKSPWLSGGTGFLGIVGIFFVFFFLDENLSYPGYFALPVTISTMLVIISGKSVSVTHRALGLRLLTSVGLISYSLYLWHWPVLAFARYCLGELSNTQKFLSLLLMILLSILSYKFVEQPCRHYKTSVIRAFVYFFVVPSFTILLTCSAIYLSSGLGSYYWSPTYSDELSSVKNEGQAAYVAPYVCQKSQLSIADTISRECILGGQNPKVLLWGDSHAAHYVSILSEFADEYNFGFRNFEHSSCPPVLSTPEKYATSKWRARCEKGGLVARSAMTSYEYVIVAAAWSAYHKADSTFYTNVEASLQNMVANGQKLLVLGDVPYSKKIDRKCLQKNLKLQFLDCKNRATTAVVQTQNANKRIKEIALRVGAAYFDLTRFLCDGKGCSNYFGGIPVYFDSSHLSLEGGHLIGEAIKSDEEVKRIFSRFSRHKQ